MANTSKILSALIVGAVAGAAFGVLFAPDKGSETRKKISGKASDLSDELKSRLNKTKVAANDIKERVSNRVDDIKERMAGRTEDIKNSSTPHSNYH